MRYWESFCRQFLRDAQLWLLFVAALTVNRLLFIAVYRDELQLSGLARNLFAALLAGVRFDSMAVSYCLLPSLLVSVLAGFIGCERAAQRVRGSIAAILCLLTPLLGCASIEYYREYADVFNHFLFNAYYDNQAALLVTVYEQYHLFRHLFVTFALCAVGVWVWRRFFRNEWFDASRLAARFPGHLSRSLAGVVVVAVVVLALRGSWGRAPVNRRDAHVGADDLLNKAALNPYIALSYAAREQLEVAGEAGLQAHLPDENIVRAVERVFPDCRPAAEIDEYLQRVAAGPPNVAPRHIFVLGMESYDAWTLLDKYRPLGTTEELRALAARGLHIRSFLPADDFSMRFCNAVITGLPDAGIQTNWQRTAQGAFPTSLPQLMRKLGYRTRYFCGAPLDWQNCRHFCPAQGFDEAYGSLDIVRGTPMEHKANLWAAPDELLWKFIREKINDDEPSFTFVLSSSYHVPYDIDLEAEGCPLRSVPPELESEFTKDRAEHLRKLGHLWYADKCLGQFVKQMEKEVRQPLFVITGDHYGRNFINAQPSLFERSAVPLILYGPEVLEGVKLPAGVAGGHIDLPATIVELAAPRGFVYHAVGKNLLAANQQFFGYGSGKIIGSNFILEVERPDVLHPIPGQPLPESVADLPQLLDLYRCYRGLAWWRLKRGSRLPVEMESLQVPQIATSIDSADKVRR